MKSIFTILQWKNDKKNKPWIIEWEKTNPSFWDKLFRNKPTTKLYASTSRYNSCWYCLTPYSSESREEPLQVFADNAEDKKSQDEQKTKTEKWLDDFFVEQNEQNNN